MWQHRLAVRRADASLAAFKSYLAKSKELAATTRSAMKLIHELEFVEAGFAFLPASTATAAVASANNATLGNSGTNASACSGRQWTEQV